MWVKFAAGRPVQECYATQRVVVQDSHMLILGFRLLQAHVSVKQVMLSDGGLPYRWCGHTPDAYSCITMHIALKLWQRL